MGLGNESLSGLFGLAGALDEEAIEQIACALELARQRVRVAAEGDRGGAGLVLGRLVAHQRRGDLGRDARVVEPRRRGVPGLVQADRLQAQRAPRAVDARLDVAEVEHAGRAVLAW